MLCLILASVPRVGHYVSDALTVDPFLSTAATDVFAGTDTADRRRRERIAAPMPAWISGESHDRSARGRDVSVIDLSDDGVGFRDARSSYRIGAAHWLVINGLKRLSSRVRIVSCRANDAGGYVVGAMFF